MSNISNQEFIDFILSYSSNDKYFNTITEISRTGNGDRTPLIRNKFKMISLDDICQNSKAFGYNFPKTADALWYKEDNGKFTLYIIEFKFYDLDSAMNRNNVKQLREHVERKNKEYFEDNFSSRYLFGKNFFNTFLKVEKSFENSIDAHLKLKPVDTLLDVLPNLYKEYCGFDDEEDAEDCREFFKSIEIKFYVFLMKSSEFDLKAHNEYVKRKMEEDKYSKNRNHKGRSRGRFNPSRTRISANASKLHLQFLRYKHANLFDDYKILANDQFSSFLKVEGLLKE